MRRSARRLLRALSLASCLVFALQSAGAQATQSSAPADDYLLRITQGWAGASPLGALPSLEMASDDVELRVWGGYGRTQTSGIILRRSGGQWQTWRATVVRCHLHVGIPIGDTASAATESLFVKRAHEKCGASIGDTRRGARIYDADTLAVESLANTDAEAIWTRVVAEGVLQLPPRVPRKWMMDDGFTLVIEVRRGNSYRASVIEAVGAPEVRADSVARFVYETVFRGANSPAESLEH
jgi:hypothetical protein